MATVRKRTSSLTDRTRWAVLYRKDGQQTSTTFDTAKTANDFKSLVEILGPDKAEATLEPQAAVGISVAVLFDQWIEWKASTDVTPRTLKEYGRDYTNWIEPRLGKREADSLDELDVQQWVDWMAKTLDPKTVGDRHMILGSLYKFGVAKSRRLVTQNPTLETQLPSKKSKAVKGFTLAQWAAMHEWAEIHEPDADDLLVFIASTGWRFSEATAIAPAAIEDYGDQAMRLDDGTEAVLPIVFASVLGVHRKDEHDRIVYVEGVAKSRAGVRRVNLNPAAAYVVRRRMTGLKPDALLFTNSRAKRWHSTNFIAREFQRILDGADIEKARGMGPHWLRHTQVAMLERSGASASKMQRRIGHESITTTLGVYGGMIDNTLSPTELLRLDAQVVRPAAADSLVAGEVVRGELD